MDYSDAMKHQAIADAEAHAASQAAEDEYYAMVGQREYEQLQNMIEEMRVKRQLLIDKIESKKQEIEDCLNELAELNGEAMSFGYIL